MAQRILNEFELARVSYNRLQKMLRHSHEVVPPSFEHGLVLLATLIRGGGRGETQAQDHRQAI